MGNPTKGKPLVADDLGRESREGFQRDGLSARLGRYARARENALQFRDFLLREGEDRLANDLGGCGNYVTFRDYYTVGQVRLARMCTCKKHLICPLCAIRRGAKALRVYLARVQQLMRENPTYRAYMVTLTVKNGDDLAERFKHLADSLRAYHKRRHGARQIGEIRKAKAAVWSYEFTNRGKGWHPHVHAVWLCEDEPDAHKLSNEWHGITGDSYIVDVRPVDPEDPVSGFLEVFKYALKFSDLDDGHRLDAFHVLRAKRLQDAFGALRGLDVEPSESDDLLQDLPYIDRLFSFRRGVGYVESSRMVSPDLHANHNSSDLNPSNLSPAIKPA